MKKLPDWLQIPVLCALLGGATFSIGARIVYASLDMMRAVKGQSLPGGLIERQIWFLTGLLVGGFIGAIVVLYRRKSARNKRETL